ncbi:hypothetical protein TVAG_481960 [Trichomonas vaginalis G3]|uniref:MSP domain-containing protein n=1 Tax=Trichomonas vaginalis (strain ATCC PRA-98 / G3) TaxID=412133 RepID=A2EBK5_TRIV3|nr:deleted in lung and esophageal cancer 1 (DLEC1) family [Trichomonas vaginalis G3]EAY09922.1 hypothetical protein TVAG_481960 [Trichomonas vaginalis G3]KAI5523060.1 deleted in lung and esophageal cancer 1 (DLEC1) family [Trichomonas vaginalis G3]|eukprot:XP_001322145.1 hypothetical protein [Trichomonas vaginalis G3]
MGLFPPTVFGATTRLVVKIINNSDKLLRYEWRQFSSEEQENTLFSGLDDLSPQYRQNKAENLVFKSKIFKFENSSSEIWPKRYQQVIVSFTPMQKEQVNETAYLYNIDTKERIPFPLQGSGIPPHAEINLESINAGHISFDKSYEYEILLRNNGMIPFDYEINDYKDRQIGFEFNPDRGSLNVGQTIPIHINVIANHIGLFNEIFNISIIGAEYMSPSLVIRGRVIGPTFDISPKTINFGTVSFGFLYTQTLEITNDSEIPFNYDLAIHQDPTFDLREISILPNHGTVQGFAKQKLKLEFLPNTLRNYDLSLQLTSPEYEKVLQTIPIKAECICPEVSIIKPEIDVGQVFINKRTPLTVKICNRTGFPAKYEFIEPTDPTILEANFEIEKRTGDIPAMKLTEVKFYITPKIIGSIHLVRFIKILGSNMNPLSFYVNANSIGPIINYAEKEIDFGIQNVLIENNHEIVFENKSAISADYKVQVRGRCFSINEYEGSIPPNSSHSFNVVAKLTDAQLFTGEFYIIIEHLTPITIPMKARGKGSPIISSIDMNKIDFGYSFVDDIVSKSFVLTNFGTKPLEVKWDSRRTNRRDLKLSIEPDIKVIYPNEKIPYTISLTSNIPNEFNIKAVCSQLSSKKTLEIFNTELCGKFICHSLSFSKNAMYFNYVHDAIQEETLNNNDMKPSKSLLMAMYQTNTVMNKGELPLDIYIECQEPFSVSPNRLNTQPGQSYDIDVIFDPSFKEDFSSETITQTMNFIIENNPHTFTVDLIANMMFPNLSFDFPQNKEIDFGLLLKNTEGQKSYKMKNTSKVDVEYEWTLLYDDNDIDISTVFDICPIRGTLKPNETVNINVSFYSKVSETKSDFQINAVCHVIGGPDYVFKLMGRSADIDYKVNPTEIDFGDRSYIDNLTSIVIIENTSQVNLPFHVKTPYRSGFSQFVVEPSNGVLSPGEMKTLNVSLVAGVPLQLKECFNICFDEFQEVEIQVQVNSFIFQLQTNIPRASDDPLYQIFMKKPRRNVFKILQANEISREHYSNIEYDMMKDRLLEKVPKTRSVVQKHGLKTFQGRYNSKFVIDMGTIILGDSKEMSFDFNSIVPFPISFEIFDSNLIDTGFYVKQTNFTNISKDDGFSVAFGFDTKKRKDDKTDDVIYDVPLVFNDESAYLIQIKAKLESPALEFSTNHLDFEQTIIGQKRIKSVQIRNNNALPIDFTISPCESPSIIHKLRKEDNPFKCSTTTCSLPPNNFININVTFSPTQEKNYSMQFPITIKHSSQTMYLTVKGSGSQLKLVFDPPELCFQPTKPFSDKLFMDFKMINPTNSPITVYSNQFDFQMLYEQVMAGKSTMLTVNSTESNLILESNKDVVSNFAVCIIVHGVTKSGKTTCAKRIAKYLGLEILDLQELFMGKQTQGECVEILTERLKQKKYIKGFIVDGLNGMPDPQETDQFLAQTLKHKGVLDEIAKDPFIAFPHNFQTGYEQTLSLLLSCLTGHFVFGVFLQASDADINLHEIDFNSEIQYNEQVMKNQDLERYLNMDEEEYSQLTKIEQIVADRYRTEYRMKFLPPKEIKPQPTKAQIKSNASKSNLKSGSRASLKSQKSTASLKGLNAIKSRTRLKLGEKEKINHVYNFTLGTIAQRINEDCDQYHAIDPLSYRKGDEIVEVTYPHKGNCLLINTGETPYQNEKSWKSFIPDLDKLRLRILVNLLQPMRLIVPSMDPDEKMPHLEIPPSNFGIWNDEAPAIPQQTPKPPPPQNLKKARMSRREKRIESELSANKSEDEAALFEDYNLIRYTKRWEINPGESVSLKAYFNGVLEGEYIDILRFSILDAANNIFSLPMKANVTSPDIDRDPTSLFSKVVPKLGLKTKSSFISSLNEFHFGPINPSLVKPGSKGFKPAYNEILTIKNNSPMETIIMPYISSNAPKNTWFVETKEFTIQPNEKYQYKIGFNPMNIELYKATISFFIKDNPKPLITHFVADVTNPTIEPSVQVLDFEKLLPKQERNLTLELRNNGKIPCYFKFKNIKQIGNQFQFSCKEGLIPLKGTFKVDIKFSSPKPIIVKKTLIIDVYDEKQTKVANNYNIGINAETFDTSFDLIYPKGMSMLDFNVIKCNESKNLVCTLKNKGKYPLHYKFDLNKNFPYLKISHLEGTISPSEKPLAVTFTFSAKKIVKFENKKVLNLIVCDEDLKEKQNVMPIILHAETTNSLYEISPTNILDFGPCIINTPAQKSFTIKNVGHFPFEFEIHQVIPEENNDDAEKQSTGSRRSARSNKGKQKPKVNKPAKTKQQMPKKNKKGNQKIQYGPFLLSTWWGIINPNQTATITVDFVNSLPVCHSINLLLKITDCPVQDENGIPYTIKSECFIPTIETEDFEQIFKGQRLCLRGDLLDNDCTAFLEDEKCLHFAALRVKSESTVPVSIINIQQVPVSVDFTLSEPKGFKIDNAKLEIPEKEEAILNVTFCPNESGTFTSILQGVVKAYGKDPPQTMRIMLEGKGSLPLIEFVDAKSKSYSFGRTLVGTQKEHKVAIANRSLIDSNVTFHVSPNPDFILEGLEATKPINLRPNEIFNFTVIFRPERSKHSSISVQAKVFGNISSNLSMDYDGEGLIEDLILDGNDIENDSLTFDDVVAGTKCTKKFIMKNVCEKDIRYQWSCQSQNDFIIVPSCGHLFSKNSIEVFVTYQSDKPTKLNTKMTCSWSYIKLEKKEAWNDSMKESKMIIDDAVIVVQPPKEARRSARRKGGIQRQSSKNLPVVKSFTSKRVVVTKPEPAFTYDGPKQKDIVLKLIATSDVIKTNISVNGDKSVNSLNFAPTMMFESRRTPIEINNQSKIAVRYMWKVINYSTMDGEKRCPFSVDPYTGIIPSNTVKSFDVVFSPTAVDDCSCDICVVFGDEAIETFEKMSHDDLQFINVTGLSRRPICHFDVKQSDYLNRRHPDYTYHLPEDVKVVEVSSKEVGEKAQLKFGIMNTTNMMYESYWHLVSGQDAISCETPIQIISSNRRYEMIFDFTPTSVKTIETLWEFKVPQHNVCVPFLIVGKVIPQ